MKSTIIFLLGVTYSLVCIVTSVRYLQANVQHVVNLKNLFQKMSTEEKDSLQSYYWSELLDHLSKQNGAASQHSFLNNLLDNRREKAFLKNLLSKFDQKEKVSLQQYFSRKLLHELMLNQDSTRF